MSDMKKYEKLVWVEAFRPQDLDGCVLKEQTKKDLKAAIENTGGIPNITFSGSPGCGKTTLAKVLCDQLEYDWILINSSNEGRIIETLRSKISNFASSVSFEGKRKCVILDEADGLPTIIQDALRGFIEEFHTNCSFILTCNIQGRLSDALKSRCPVIDFSISKDEKPAIVKQMFLRISQILENENVEFDKRVVGELVVKHFPDMRKMLNLLQWYSSTGKIDSGIFVSSQETDLKQLIKILKEKDFKAMRTWVATTQNQDFASLRRSLYDNAYEIVEKDSLPQFVILLSDYQFKDAFAADKELNLAAMFTSFMVELEFKDG